MEERSLLFEYLAVVKRRRWLIAIPIALGLLVGVVLVQMLPREYRSSTTLAVTSPNMTTELVKSSPRRSCRTGARHFAGAPQP